MPELPEVETSRRGIAPHMERQQISGVIVRDRRLRWPVPDDIDRRLPGQRISAVRRRAKYLLIETPGGTAMPQWKGSIPDEDIWAMAHYVRDLIDKYKNKPAERARFMAGLRN